MLKTEIVNKINFPEIALQEDLERIAKDIIIPDIIAGIDNGMAITGGALPENELSTIKRKGHDRQLIDTGELRSSFFYRTVGKNKVIITIQSGRKKIGGHLQGGIKTLRGIKQYKFFGISLDAHDGAMQYIRNKIKELTRGGRCK